ncbi:MAG: alpha/beta fold hydrolase [Spirochaetes bacterium]|nr:alpha/beta fold hydrolase [Spirochaetota bacterium]
MPERILPGAQAVVKFNNKMFGVLLLHGFAGNPSEYKYLIQRCEDEKFSYYAPRYPGHGTSADNMDLTAAHDWSVCAREAYIELSSHCDRVYVIGHSIGACFAVNIANEFNPEKTVLISMPVDTNAYNSQFIKNRKSEMKTRYINDPEESLKYTGYNSGIPAKKQTDLIKIIRQTLKSLPNFHTDVLIFQSVHDEIISHDSADLVYDSIISIRKQKIMLENSAHIIMLDYDRDVLADRIFSFLKD